MKFRTAGLFLCLLAIRCLGASSPALIPLPLQMQLSNGVFTLCPTPSTSGFNGQAATKILADPAFLETGQYLASVLLKSTGYNFVVSTNTASAVPAGAILLTTATTTNAGPEGYDLTVRPDSVVIQALTSAGSFYGVQTLLQLLPPQIYSLQPAAGISWTAPCLHIFDTPRFPWRGFMMDSVRHFWSKDDVKVQLDTMAMHKLNTMHWHLCDDSGWRLEITNWPALTQVGAWRTDIGVGGYRMWDLNSKSSTTWRDDGMYGGYYTQDDVRELVTYAAQRHITIVPEIEMPGHANAAVSAYPQFSCGGTGTFAAPGTADCPTCLYPVPHSLNNTAYNGGCFCIARPETFAFLQSVLAEVMNLFPSHYIHIGGDEVVYSNWNHHSLDKAMTNSLGINDMAVYQTRFTQQVANWVASQGRLAAGWSDIYDGGIVTNCLMTDWLDTTASTAANNGQYVVRASSASLYINHWENGSSSGGGVVWSNDAPAQSGYTPLANVYNFEPVPSDVTGSATNFVLGLEAPCWAEWVPSLYNMQFKMYPRLSAASEVAWTSKALKNYSDFTSRLAVHKQRLDSMGVNYNPSATPPVVATWTTPVATIYPTFSTTDWDITSSLTNVSRGEIDLTFCWKSGARGLYVEWAALLENGVEVDRDTHTANTGSSNSKLLYVLKLPNGYKKPGATYTLRASIAGQGGTDSSGTVYFTKWN